MEEVQGPSDPEDEEPLIDLSKLDHDAVKDVFDLSQLAAATNDEEEDDGEEGEEEKDEEEEEQRRNRKGRKGRGRRRRRKNRGKRKEEQEVDYGMGQQGLSDGDAFDGSTSSQVSKRQPRVTKN